MTALQIETVPIALPPPDDETPEFDTSASDYDPDYPGSTPEAPYGFKEDGTPYKRRPKGSSGSSGKSAAAKAPSKANEALATSAARALCQVNTLIGMSLTVFGMPKTAEDMEKANAQFEIMAKESLRTDPALCRKILSAGASSGRTGLLVAYMYLVGSAFPAARTELKARRAEHEFPDE